MSRSLPAHPGAGRPAGLLALLAAVALVGLMMRAPVAGVTPLIPSVTDDLALSPTAAALLTSLPLLCFAAASPLVAPLARRIGPDRALIGALGLLAAGMALRPWAGPGLLLAGTLAVGLAVTVGNVVIPVLVRRDAGRRAPVVMAVSTASYGLGVATVAGSVVPLAERSGWRPAFALPAVCAGVGLLAWLWWRRAGAPLDGTLPAPDRRQRPGRAAGSPETARRPESRSVWREGDAWWLAVFFGVQSCLFYSASTWLPAQLVELVGLSETTAGTAVSAFHLVGIAGTLLVPLALRLLRGAAAAGLCFGGLWLAYCLGFALAPGLWPAWVLLGGFGQGASIGLSLTLISIRPVSADYGRELSAMVQAVAYALAALGPVLLGWAHEAAGSWTPVAWLSVGLAVVMILTAPKAGRRRPIGPPRSPGTPAT